MFGSSYFGSVPFGSQALDARPNASVTLSPGVLVLAGIIPVVFRGNIIQPPVATVTFQGCTPVLTVSSLVAVTTGVILIQGVATVTFTGYIAKPAPAQLGFVNPSPTVKADAFVSAVPVRTVSLSGVGVATTAGSSPKPKVATLNLSGVKTSVNYINRRRSVGILATLKE